MYVTNGGGDVDDENGSPCACRRRLPESVVLTALEVVLVFVLTIPEAVVVVLTITGDIVVAIIIYEYIDIN